MFYTGIDYHRSFSYVTTMNEKGKILNQKKLPSNGKIVDFLKKFGEEMEVALEASPSWYWLYDHLEDEGFQVNYSTPINKSCLRFKAIPSTPFLLDYGAWRRDT